MTCFTGKRLSLCMWTTYTVKHNCKLTPKEMAAELPLLLVHTYTYYHCRTISNSFIKHKCYYLILLQLLSVDQYHETEHNVNPYKASITTAADDILCDIFLNFRKQWGTIFHENRLPADDSHEISCLISYFWKGNKVWNCRLLQIIGGALRIYQYYYAPSLISISWVHKGRLKHSSPSEHKKLR